MTTRLGKLPTGILALLLIVVVGCEDKGSYIPDPEDTLAPGPIRDLVATPYGDSTVNLTWYAPGDEPGPGAATRYEIRYQRGNEILPWWAHATPAAEMNSSAPYSGTPESIIISGLLPMERYFFGVRSADDGANWSELSNIVDVLVGPVDLTGTWLGYVAGLWKAYPRPQDFKLELFHYGPHRSLYGTYRLLGENGELDAAHVAGDRVDLLILFALMDREYRFSGTINSDELGGPCSKRVSSTNEILAEGEWRVWLEK